MKLIPKTTRPDPFQGSDLFKTKISLWWEYSHVSGKKEILSWQLLPVLSLNYLRGGGGNIHTVVTYYENTIKKGFFTLLTTLILQGNILSECVIYNVIKLLMSLVSYSYCLYILCIFLYMVSFH